MVTVGGIDLEPTSVLVVALYDPETGTIHHVHTAATLTGGRRLSETDATSAAQEHARRLGHPVEGLAVKISTDLAHATAPHRIDPATGEFQAIDVPDLTDREARNRDGR